MAKKEATEKASIEFEGETISYTIVRSARRKKTVQIVLDPQEGVVVRSPIRTPRKDIADFVRQRADWILNNATEEVLYPKQRRFVAGESLFYLGREIPIVTRTNAEQSVRLEIEIGGEVLYADLPIDGSVKVELEGNAFCISAPEGINEEQRIATSKKAIENWYRKEAMRLLPDIVARWQSKVTHRKPAQVLIRSQRRRWGSCSSDGSIRLNWRIVMAEPALIDYVVVHELTHLNVMNHSPQFWQQVERVLPDYRARIERLNEVGAGFWF